MAVENAREIFETQIPKRLQDKPELAGNINAIFKFIVAGDDGGTWLVDLTQDGGKISEGDGDAGCTIDVGAQDLVDIVNGKLNAQMAFMSGKLKVAGEIGLAMKLGALLA